MRLRSGQQCDCGVDSSAIAEWTKFASNENKTMIIYIDPSNVGKAGNRVKMWRLFDYKTVQKAAGISYMSITSQGEYDCKEEQMRMLYASYSTKTMGRGDVVAIDQNSTKWAPASPGSIDEGLWKFACGKD